MGPLAGVKIIEFAGIGPAPMASMLLADMGATILRIDRVAAADLGVPMAEEHEFTRRSRAAIALDLKRPEAIALALRLIDGSDALIEGFRPGVMERLGLGPDVCLGRNKKLAYGRVTGWGQEGPLAQAAGHDMNYIALTGALHAIGRAGQKPTPPLNLVGDYGGGALYLVTGLLAAIISARATGVGQVVDAAMVDGALSLMTPIYAMQAGGRLSEPRGHNQLDSGAYYYEVYECSDGQFISLAPIEAKFHAELLRLLEIDPASMPAQRDKGGWARWKDVLTERFRTRTRDDWCRILEGSDACFAPVLSMTEAHAHPHNQARAAFIEVGGYRQPAPAPRFGTTKLAAPRPPGSVPVAEALAAWGLPAAEIAALSGT
ncbi:MAG TPA: CaiB/BaiF CoA-transferase family protein [Rhodopila sp.]|jgi:alpha-methylacyl-CoA racemase|nr:CaiB/BaiF CoA-transferase family protein [Rhodopila sp.]